MSGDSLRQQLRNNFRKNFCNVSTNFFKRTVRPINITTFVAIFILWVPIYILFVSVAIRVAFRT